jgi:hypothetical protein
MSFFSRGNHHRGNRGRGNWNRGPEGQGSPYILMPTHKSLANCFRLDFSTRLGREWSNLGLKGLLSKSCKPLGITIPPHISLQPEVLENDRWQEIVHPKVSQHHGWPNLSFPAPPPINPIVQASLITC